MKHLQRCIEISSDLTFLGRMRIVLINVRRNPTNRFKRDLLTKVQCFIHVLACVHKGQRGLMDINNLLSDSTIQSWDTNTSTKYLPLMFAIVRWQPVYMYNTITSWYTTMYHETSVIFNTREPWAERPSPPNIRTATKVIIVIKNNIEKKNLYLTPAETIANVSHVQFLHWLTSEHHWK